MNISLEITADDDRSTLEQLQELARQLRRKRDPKGAHTASKIELAFSKALSELAPADTEEAQS